MTRRGRGEGDIHQRPDGRWEARVSLGVQGTKRIRKSIYGQTRKDVANKLRQLLSDQDKGIVIDDDGITLAGWLDHWLESIVRPDCEPTTYEGYEIAVRLHIKPYLGNKRMRDLRAEHVDLWKEALEKKGVGMRTREVAYARLNTAVGIWSTRRARPNPVAQSSPPRGGSKKHPPPRIDDLRRLLRAIASDPHRALFILALGIGLRRGEILGLRWADVDEEHEEIAVRRRVSRVKGERLVREGTKQHPGDVRVLPLPRGGLVAQALREQLTQQKADYLVAGSRWKGLKPGDPAMWVFHSEVGTVIEPRRATLYFERLRTQLGMETRTLHGLRKDFGSLLLGAGVAGRVAQELLGHSNYAITAKTYQAVPDDLQRAAVAHVDQVLASAVGGDS